MGGHVALEERKEKHNLDKLENIERKEGRGEDTQWGCVNEAWRTVACLCVLVYFLVAGGHWMRAWALVWVGPHSPNNSPSLGHAPNSLTTHPQTHMHVTDTCKLAHIHTHASRPPPPPLPGTPAAAGPTSTQKWGRDWSGHSLRRAHRVVEEGTARRMKSWGGKKRLSIFFLRWERTKKVTVTVITPRQGGTTPKGSWVLRRYSVPPWEPGKQCCCLWPVMKIGWVVEPCFRKLWHLFKSSFLLYYPRKKTLNMWPCLSSSCLISMDEQNLKFENPGGSTVCSSA